MLKCPHCGNQAMTWGQKLLTASAQTVSCQSCGRDIGIAIVPTLLAGIPLLLAFFVGKPFLGIDFYVSVGIGIIIFFVLYVLFVPIVKRG